MILLSKGGMKSTLISETTKLGLLKKSNPYHQTLTTNLPSFLTQGESFMILRNQKEAAKNEILT